MRLSASKGKSFLSLPCLVDLSVTMRYFKKMLIALPVRCTILTSHTSTHHITNNPYGSNYFMLNLLVGYQRPEEISQVSGIPTDWRRSGYNVREKSLPLMRDLLYALESRFLLVSFNNEGFIPLSEMHALLKEIGTVDVVEVPYNAFRGSRNFNKRDIHVTEQLFFVERK